MSNYPKREPKICEVCRTSYFKARGYSFVRWAKSKYCSKQCMDIGTATPRGSYLGRELEEKARSLALKGFTQAAISKRLGISYGSAYRFSKDIFLERTKKREERNRGVREEYLTGLDTPQIAKKFNISTAWVRIICEDIKRKRDYLGSKNPAWRGGVTPLVKKIRDSDKYAAWRVSVMERDGFKCQITGQIGGKLVVDHIKPFSIVLIENDISSFEEALECEELWDIRNGRTLSKEAHIETSTYGWRTYNLIRAKSINNANAVLSPRRDVTIRK